MILIAILMGFTLIFFYLNSTNAWTEASVSLVVVIAVATALGYMGMAEEVVAFQFGVGHKRECMGYLLLGLLSVGSGLYLAMSETASLGTIALVVAPHAFIFGIAQLRIARHLQHHPMQRRALYLCGGLELLLGTALIAGSKMSNSHVAALLGYGAVVTILQLLAYLLYRHQRSEHGRLRLHTR